MVTDSESYNGFPQINHRPLVIMHGCSKRCEIDTVLDIMDHFKCSHETMTHRKNKWMEMMSPFTIDITLIQFLFCKSTGNLKECVAAITLL